MDEIFSEITGKPKAETPKPKAETPKPKAETPKPKAETPKPKAELNIDEILNNLEIKNMVLIPFQKFIMAIFLPIPLDQNTSVLSHPYFL